MVDDTDVVFTVDQTAAANTAMRTALGLPPQHFTISAFIGMISDEIQQLRERGWGDAEIAALVGESTGTAVTPGAIADHYATPEARGKRSP